MVGSINLQRRLWNPNVHCPINFPSIVAFLKHEAFVSLLICEIARTPINEQILGLKYEYLTNDNFDIVTLT